MNQQSFIETQFPVSKVSKESYKERKANLGQTLTGLGKWWGRKPLVLVRAAILAALMPATSNPRGDLDVFLRLMMMDAEGLWQRKKQKPPLKVLAELMTDEERERYLANTERLKWKTTMNAASKEAAIKKLWQRLSYDEKLNYCFRPEETDLPKESWELVNKHYGIDVHSLPEFVKAMGELCYGDAVTVGDCFAGGGSIPFEAARIGCNVIASDLNPIAGLLSWADLHIAGADDEKVAGLRKFQRIVYDAVKEKIKAWGIETNEDGDRANSYLYCAETICPECGWKVPLAPSWIIGKGTRTAAILRDNGKDGFEIEIKSGLGREALRKADEKATVRGTNIYCPHCHQTVPIAAVRHDNASSSGLRLWEKEDFLPREDDVFQERLYCIKYEHMETDADGKVRSYRYYQAPMDKDWARERNVVELLKSVFAAWQEKGYIPSGEIAEGDETSRLLRERGWKYWHHLFTPRQLLMHGLFMEQIDKFANCSEEVVIGLLGCNRLANWNSKLSQWSAYHTQECGLQTFYNQALNPFYNYTTRALSGVDATWMFNINNSEIESQNSVKISDARSIKDFADVWITDPPYADAVNYHELTEFFLAWDKVLLKKAFPDWYTDSKRVLAVKGRDESFNKSMIEIYRNLAQHMPDNGMQIIMFTHQDVAVWADLALVVWSAGLQVTAAWNIITETDASGLKNGNYVKGTVLLVLRKQQSTETAYIDELAPDIEDEVKAQIDSMQSLDDKEDPNFTDADYILAAYAAALKVLTSVRKIEDIDVEYELSHKRPKGEVSPIVQIIEEAKKIAYDQLIPRDFDNFLWRMLTPAERFYIKGLEAEQNGIYQISTYQELARGFGVVDYKELLKDTKANSARLRTGGEWARRNMEGDGFGGSLLRQVLMALYIATKDSESTPQEGRAYLKTEVQDYWNRRDLMQEMLSFIATFRSIENMKAWHKEAAAAYILKELIGSDGV